MNSADKNTLWVYLKGIAIGALVIGLLWLFWTTVGHAQTVAKEDTLSFFVTYTPRQAQALQAHLGPEWRQILKQRYWREAWRNLVHEAKDRLRFESAIIFDEGWEQYMTEQEQRQRDRIRDLTLARKAKYEEEQRIADSVAAAQQTQGSVTLPDADRPQLAGLGIGKMLSTRLALLEGFEDTRPAPATPSGSFANEDAFITYVYVVHILAVVGLISMGYWVYTAAVQ